MNIFDLFLSLFWLSQLSIGDTSSSCYYCASISKNLDVSLRRKLGGQRDIFHWPLDAASPQCHVHASKNTLPKGQICTDDSRCVVLAPNIPNVNFTIRGCADSILRYKLKKDARLDKTACFLIKSEPHVFGEEGLSYLLCLCKDSFCNDEPQPTYLPIKIAHDMENDENDIIELVEARRGERLAKNGERVGTIYEARDPNNGSNVRIDILTITLLSLLAIFGF